MSFINQFMLSDQKQPDNFDEIFQAKASLRK